jgi:hypothetical protein
MIFRIARFIAWYRTPSTCLICPGWLMFSTAILELLFIEESFFVEHQAEAVDQADR